MPSVVALAKKYFPAFEFEAVVAFEYPGFV